MLLKYIDLIFATKQGIKRTSHNKLKFIYEKKKKKKKKKKNFIIQSWEVNTQSLIKDLIGYNTFKMWI